MPFEFNFSATGLLLKHTL